MLPRLLWADKRWTLVELHRQIFKHLKFVLAEWIDWKDPSRADRPTNLRKALHNIREELNEFPY